MRFLYNIFIYLLQFACFIVAHMGNKKIKAMVDGHKRTFRELEALNTERQTTWFHCASLGEFEQARNLIETIKDKYPQTQILVTFFSPSGYEIRKNYSKADCVTYLPFDTPKNARRFVQKVNPSAVFFIKYEFWWNFIRSLNDVPLYSVSLILRKNHYLFSPVSGYFRKQLACFDYFFVQNNETASLLNQIGYTNNLIAGDTRFDRVVSMSKEKKEFPLIEKFKSSKKVFLAGSSWPEDETVIQKALVNRKDIKIILAPHLIDKNHINEIKHLFPSSVALSELSEDLCDKTDILIIDNIGMLMYLYSLCDYAYIGGGFGVGIHNILEAAVFSKPVCFGPNNKKFKEAQDLLQQGGAKQINNAEDLKDWIELLSSNEAAYKKVCALCGNYVKNNEGATEKIINKVWNIDEKR